MTAALKTTPLHQWHKGCHANMADFGGYDMPLWYETGVKTEHLAVLKSAGIFDTSHMACILVSGDGAFDLLNACFTRDLGPLKNGRCVYGAFLNALGHCMDDAIVYRFSATRFMVCVNAGMGAGIAAHLEGERAGQEAVVEDLSGAVAKMDIQGKNAARILARVIQSPETVFSAMPYFSFKGHFHPHDRDASQVRLLDGTPVLLSRSGYTGEFGFEIFLAPGAITSLWEDLLEAGKDMGITACGLGARDSLRAGACLPLSHQDIGPWEFIRHPWEFALPWAEGKTSFTKSFLGDRALLAASQASHVYPFAGDSLKKVPAGKDTRVFRADAPETDIGHVLTCATDMGAGRYENRIVSINTPGLPETAAIKGLSCGFVMVSQALEPGTRLVLIQGKRRIEATVVTDIRPDRTARKKLDTFI